MKSIPLLNIQNFVTRLFQNEEVWNEEQPHPAPFCIFKRSSANKCHISVNRRDFYKIAFVIEGTGELKFGGTSYSIQPGDLIFLNPIEPKEWHSHSEEQDGYYTLFTESFFNEPSDYQFLIHYPFFQLNATPVLRLKPEQQKEVLSIFENIMQLHRSHSSNKLAIIKHYLYILMLQAKSFANVIENRHPVDSAHQLTLRFFHLLEEQFPIENTEQQIRFRKPSQFAQQLHVHVNYLNHAVKETTGNTVSDHISKRITQEAKLLLQYTDWPVNHIGYTLGFDEIANFTNFFKKATGFSPRTMRQTKV